MVEASLCRRCGLLSLIIAACFYPWLPLATLYLFALLALFGIGFNPTARAPSTAPVVSAKPTADAPLAADQPVFNSVSASAWLELGHTAAQVAHLTSTTTNAWTDCIRWATRLRVWQDTFRALSTWQSPFATALAAFAFGIAAYMLLFGSIGTPALLAVHVVLALCVGSDVFGRLSAKVAAACQYATRSTHRPAASSSWGRAEATARAADAARFASVRLPAGPVNI